MSAAPIPPLRRLLAAFGWALLAGAASSTLFALWLLGATLGLVGESRTVEGVVVGHVSATVSTTAGRGAAMGQRSVVRFEADDGNTYTFTENLVRRLDAIHELGERVSVRYHPAAPEQAAVVWPWLRGIGAVLLLGAAAIAALLGGLLVLLTRRAGRA